MDNIDRFNILVGLVLERLYGAFPIPIFELRAEDFVAKIGVELDTDGFWNGDADDQDFIYNKGRFVGHFPNFPGTEVNSYGFFIATLQWLTEEGFIRSSSHSELAQVVLTSRGFSALAATPALLQATGAPQSVGDQLRDAAKFVGKEGGKTSIGELAKYAIGFGVSAAKAFL